KRYFIICIAAFTLFSFLCGVSQSLTQLIIFRLLQGFFGGGLQPNQQSIILDTFEPAQRGRAFAVVAIAIIIAPIIGPTLGGLITDHYSWRWVFLFNIPVGIGAVFAVGALVEDPPWVVRDRSTLRDADYVGLTLIAILAAIGILGAIAWLLYTDRPVVDLHVFKDRNFAVGTIVIAAIGAILYS